MPKPGIRACARSGFPSLFHRPKKANARRFASRGWALCEGPGRPLSSHLTDCLPGSHKNRNPCSVKGTYIAAERQLRDCAPATFHQTRWARGSNPGTTAAGAYPMTMMGPQHPALLLSTPPRRLLILGELGAANSIDEGALLIAFSLYTLLHFS